jgi:hypothetical protein
MQTVTSTVRAVRHHSRHLGTTVGTFSWRKTYEYLDRRIERKIDDDGSDGSNPADYYCNVYRGDNA